jgi:hypothetical protein
VLAEAHVQQRQTDRAVVLDLRHDHDGAVVAATLGDHQLALVGDQVLGALQRRLLVGARLHVGGDAAAVEHVRGRAAVVERAVDGVARAAERSQWKAALVCTVDMRESGREAEDCPGLELTLGELERIARGGSAWWWGSGGPDRSL